MKILHTSDWHIGKRLMDRERLHEQVEVLDEIEEICEREGVELLLVAGDVFDTYVPSAEAEEVFFRAVKKFSQKRPVVLIAGNHDDGVRLAASAPFASDSGVFIYGNRPYLPDEMTLPCGMRVVRAGENYLVFENKAGERVYLNLLPYPNEARLKEDKSDESYGEKAARWIKKGDEGYDGGMPHILVTHIFAAGGKVSDSERSIDLGGARAVPLSALPQFGYIALGHLHRSQRVGENGYYSGSILQYSFDEANTEKSVILLETKGENVEIAKKIPLTRGKKLVRLECNGVDEACSLLARYENEYIELTLNLKAPLSSAETKRLRESNRDLVSLLVRVEAGAGVAAPLRSALRPDELFADYYKLKHNDEIPKDILAAFLELTEGEA